MNIDRLATIALWLESSVAPPAAFVPADLRFDITEGISVADCGTICCIAGAACLFFGGEQGRDLHLHAAEEYADCCEVNDCRDGDYEELGMAPWHLFEGRVTVQSLGIELLGLNADVAGDLFHAREIDGVVTPAQAARCIRHLIETGSVNWSAACN